MGRLGTRDDMTTYQQYVTDIIAGVTAALTAVDPTPYFAKYGDNSWAAVKQYQPPRSTTPPRPSSRSTPASWPPPTSTTASTAFVILESIRLDLGAGSQITPDHAQQPAGLVAVVTHEARHET